jgi:hypothetical protein
VEAAPLAGAGIWPAGEPLGPDWLFLNPIVFSFLFRGFIAFIFSVQGPLCKILILNSHNLPDNISV